MYAVLEEQAQDVRKGFGNDVTKEAIELVPGIMEEAHSKQREPWLYGTVDKLNKQTNKKSLLTRK